MNVDPRPGGLGQFVLHVVGLVKVELQVQAVVRASHCNRLHLHITHVKANVKYTKMRSFNLPLLCTI